MMITESPSPAVLDLKSTFQRSMRREIGAREVLAGHPGGCPYEKPPQRDSRAGASLHSQPVQAAM